MPEGVAHSKQPLMEIEKRANEEREHETVFDLCPQRPPGSLFEPREFGQVFHHAHVTSKVNQVSLVVVASKLPSCFPLYFLFLCIFLYVSFVSSDRKFVIRYFIETLFSFSFY